MKDFSFNNRRYMKMLNKQVIHMDQAVCYNPEYIASRNMHDYPSRVMQIVRAVFLGEIEATQYGADIVFRSILSGQGERWQNFFENPSEYLFCQMIGRSVFLSKGFSSRFDDTEVVNKDTAKIWSSAIPLEKSDTALLLDEGSYAYTKESAHSLASFLVRKNIRIAEYGPYDMGFSKLAAGRIEDGVVQMQTTLKDLKSRGIRRVITVSGLDHYALTILAKEFELDDSLSVVNILDLAESVACRKAFIYGGSFYTRYLGYDKRINELTKNTSEQTCPNTWEFQPAIIGDIRVNLVNRWIAPICAEFTQSYIDKKTAAAIYANAVSRINSIPHEQVVVCDPYAFNALKTNGKCNGNLVYYWDVLR